MKTFPKAIQYPKAENYLRSLVELDPSGKSGKMFALGYYVSEEHTKFVDEIFSSYSHINALNPMVYRSALMIEKEVMAILQDLFHGVECGAVGTATSGGTESIFLAMKAYRSAFRKRGGEGPGRLVIPNTAHPAFSKAAEWLDLELVRIPCDSTFGVDLKALSQALDPSTTVAVVASAPQFPHGVMDPIPEIGKLCENKKIPLHVDACVGGLFMPFARLLGEEVPDFDFSVPGVTSLSVDLHKYGYSLKGTSAVLFRNASDRKEHYFTDMEWNGGIFATSTLLGTRSVAPIASALACFHALGREGYTEMARQVIGTRKKIEKTVSQISFLKVNGNPMGPMLSIAGVGETFERFVVLFAQKGYHFDLISGPRSMHLSLAPTHSKIEDELCADLLACARDAENPKVEVGSSTQKILEGQIMQMAQQIGPDAAVKEFMGHIYSGSKSSSKGSS